MKKYIYLFLGLMVGIVLSGTNIIYSYPTAEDMNIQIQKLYNNIENLIGKDEVAKHRVMPLYLLNDSQVMETAWEQTVANLQELNYILDKELYGK